MYIYVNPPEWDPPRDTRQRSRPRRRPHTCLYMYMCIDVGDRDWAWGSIDRCCVHVLAYEMGVCGTNTHTYVYIQPQKKTYTILRWLSRWLVASMKRWSANMGAPTCGEKKIKKNGDMLHRVWGVGLRGVDAWRRVFCGGRGRGCDLLVCTGTYKHIPSIRRRGRPGRSRSAASRGGSRGATPAWLVGLLLSAVWLIVLARSVNGWDLWVSSHIRTHTYV